MKKETLSKRNSSIETVKLFATFLIVTNHVTRSIQPAEFYHGGDYSIILNSAPENLKQFILNCFCYFGPIGNAIFLICSIWFLLESSSIKQNRVKSIIIDTWVTSVVLCSVFNIVEPNVMPRVYLLRSLLPIINNNNWYITCYLLLYLIHPFLNIMINNVEQRNLLKLCIGLFSLYFIIAFVSEKLMYYSNLVFFVSSYIITGYIKKYSKKYVTDKKINVIVSISSACICIILLAFTWIASKSIPALEDKMLMFVSNNNPFTFFTAFSIFNLAREYSWHNSMINNLSSLSLLIYVIHENIYVKNILRPYLWDKSYELFGYTNLILLDIIYSLIFYISALILALMFRLFNRKVSYKVIGPIFDYLSYLLGQVTCKIH